MAFVESAMLPLGTPAPYFDLLDTVSGKSVSLGALQSEIATVVVFSCNHCPYVLHINSAWVALAKTYQAQGVSFVAISSNDITCYPQDAPERMTALAAAVGYPFPYLYDATQAVAKAYSATCTPDFFVFDGSLHLAYRGQFCASRPSNGLPVTGNDLCAALDNIIGGFPVAEPQRPSGGCGIKWRIDDVAAAKERV